MNWLCEKEVIPDLLNFSETIIEKNPDTCRWLSAKLEPANPLRYPLRVDAVAQLAGLAGSLHQLGQQTHQWCVSDLDLFRMGNQQPRCKVSEQWPLGRRVGPRRLEDAA